MEHIKKDPANLSNLSRKELIEMINQLKFVLRYDSLTALIKTENEGKEFILERLKKAKGHQESVSLIRLDLISLKKKNKRLGHEEVNNLLQKFAKKLEDIAGEEGIAMRFHRAGDEFGILTFNKGGEELKAIKEQLEGGFNIEGEEFKMSLGIALLGKNELGQFKEPGEMWDKLAKEADAAERESKRKYG